MWIRSLALSFTIKYLQTDETLRIHSGFESSIHQALSAWTPGSWAQYSALSFLFFSGSESRFMSHSSNMESELRKSGPLAVSGGER